MKKKTTGSILKRTCAKRFNRGGFPIVLSVIIIVLVVFLNVFAGLFENELSLRIDLTRNRLYTLSKETANVLDGMHKNVEIYSLFETNREVKLVAELIEKYAAKSDGITYRNVDPVKEPVFTQNFGAAGEGIATNSVIITDREKRRFKVISPTELFSWAADDNNEVYPVAFLGEQKITSAIHYVETGKIPTVKFLSGHGESTSVSALVSALHTANYEVDDFSFLASDTALDPKNDTLVVVSPRKDMSDVEYDALVEFLTAGGDAVFFMDNVFMAPDTGALRLISEPLSNFNALFMRYGMSLNNDYIVGENSSRTYQKNTNLIPDMSGHPICLKISGKTPMLGNVSSIDIPENASDTITVVPLLTTDRETYAKQISADLTTLKKAPGDTTGPFVIGALAQKGDSRIALYGTSSFVTSTDTFTLSGNQDLAINTFSFLTQKMDSISLTPKPILPSRMQITSDNARVFLIIIVLIIIPFGILLTGFLVWRKLKKL